MQTGNISQAQSDTSNVSDQTSDVNAPPAVAPLQSNVGGTETINAKQQVNQGVTGTNEVDVMQTGNILQAQSDTSNVSDQTGDVNAPPAVASMQSNVGGNNVKQQNNVIQVNEQSERVNHIEHNINGTSSSTVSTNQQSIQEGQSNVVETSGNENINGAPTESKSHTIKTNQQIEQKNQYITESNANNLSQRIKRGKRE